MKEEIRTALLGIAVGVTLLCIALALVSTCHVLTADEIIRQQLK